MYNLSVLLQSLPHIQQSRLVGSGCAAWLSWSGAPNTAMAHTLKDYGGVLMAQDTGQALWFFPGPEVFRAVARLQIWSRLNSMPMLCQVVPATFLVGYDFSFSLSLSPELTGQQANPGQEFAVWVHPKLKEMVESIPGLDLKSGHGVTGFASSVQWLQFHADQGLDYETTLGWFFVIKPLGRMGDKESILGWRGFFTEIQAVLQRMDLKYISDVREGYVIFPLGSVRLLRAWCQEMLGLVRSVKAGGREYWPCVMAAIPQKGLTFSAELPKKVPLDWNRLGPDYPHLQYRDAFPLTEWFKINEIRQGAEQEGLETWCGVSLKSEEGEAGEGSLDVPLPRKLTIGEGQGCFYCGLKDHTAATCPTRAQTRLAPEVWSKLAAVNMDDLVSGLQTLDQGLEPSRVSASLEQLAAGGDKTSNLLARAVFEINASSQLRTLQMVWRSRGKDWSSSQTQLAPEDAPYAWASLDALRGGELERAETMLKQASLKYMRSYQPPSLLGFVALEKGDAHQAAFYWQEAERLSYTPLQQSYFLYLQGRAQEMQGEFKEASALFKRAAAASPDWLDPAYREAVCLVKMGFTGQGMDILERLIERDPNIFNRVLLDLELDRGRMQIMGALHGLWRDAEAKCEEEKALVATLSSEVAQRFEDGHAFFETAQERLERMRRLTERRNYVAYRSLVSGVDQFADEMNAQVEADIKRIRARAEHYYDRLRDIQREAAWFPFPKLLLEFNKDFNYCVEKMNWMRDQHLKVAENFRKTLRFLDEIEDRIGRLQKRLVTLRIVRDSTLFVLLLGRTFIWLEIIGLGLALVTIPLLIYMTRHAPGNWLVNLILEQKWEFQKGLVIILSVLALGLAAVKTAFSFEKRKRLLFERKEQEFQDRVQARRAAMKSAGPGGGKAQAGAKPPAKAPAKPPAKAGPKGK
ncbi:tetratricopeptide repeat protein [Desulfovibrio aminophilus]|nr:tetratricopeptide repeat protein [Desulfovibrio aminophilus]MCM0756325.1 tetratricopeptide repeat protein [Desulfovibrio aminophilus]